MQHLSVKEGHYMWPVKTGIFVCLFVYIFFYWNFKIEKKWNPSLFIYLVTTAVQFSFILCGWLRMFILLFHFVFRGKFASHDQCNNLCLLFRGVNYAAAASYPYVSPWSLAPTCVSRACHSRFTLPSAPEEEKAYAAVSCCTRLFLAKWFMIPESILVQTLRVIVS